MVIVRLISLSLKLINRFVSAGLGLLLVLAGVVASLTFVGALIGIPLILFGVLLLRHSLFNFV